MDNLSFQNLVVNNANLCEDMLSLLKAASKEKRKEKRHAKQMFQKPSTDRTAPDAMDGDPTHLEPIANSSLISTDDISAKGTSTGSNLYNAIAPMTMVANSIITSIYNSFVDNCQNSKRINDYIEQVKNWEKQIRRCLSTSHIYCRIIPFQHNKQQNL